MKRLFSVLKIFIFLSFLILLTTCTNNVPDCLTFFTEKFESGDFSSHNWILGGAVLPVVQNLVVYDGSYAVEFGDYADNQKGTLKVSVNIPQKAYIKFYRKIDAEYFQDRFYFKIDDEESGAWTAEGDWAQVIREITTPGTHTFEWEYSRGTRNSDYESKAWLDDIVISSCGDMGSVVNVSDSALNNYLLNILGKAAGPIYSNELKDFTYLRLRSDSLSDITGVEKMLDLNYFDIFSNSVASLDPLSQLSKLEIIIATNNDLEDLDFVSNLINLRILGLSYNAISSVYDIQNLTNLEELSLNGNEISDISPLQYLSNLRRLFIFQNDIANITPLGSLTELRTLDLMTNYITDITPISNLINLTSLRLMNNNISDLSPLLSLVNILSLNLRSCGLTDISDLEFITSLNDLNLSYNNISDIQPLVDNAGLGSGDTLDISNNALDLTPGSQDMINIGILQARGVTVTY